MSPIPSKVKDIIDPSRITKRKLRARKREERLVRIETQVTEIARVLLDVSESVETIKKGIKQNQQNLESDHADIKRVIYETTNRQLRIVVEKEASPQSPDCN